MESNRDLLEGITRAQALMLNGDAFSAMDTLLDLALRLTESEYGFIGEVLRDEDDAPFVRTHAITNIAWDKASRDFYAQADGRNLEFRSLQSLLGAALQSGEPVIANDPASDARRGGLPGGHPPLRCFLGLPIKRNDELVGLVGVANRTDGYDDQMVEFLEPFLDNAAYWIVSLRREATRLSALTALRESETRAQAVLDAALDAIITISEDGTILSANAATTRMFGHEADELLGRNVSMLMPEPHASEHNGHLRAYLRTGEKRIIGIGREVEGRHKNGYMIPIDLAVAEVRLPKARLFTGVLRDLTRQKEAEEASRTAAVKVKRSRDDLTAVLNQSRVGIVILDETGCITFISESGVCRDDAHREACMGKRWQTALPIGVRAAADLEGVIRKEQNRRTRLTLPWVAEGEATYWVEAEVKDDPRDPRGRILYFYDVTEVHALRSELDTMRYGQLVGESAPMHELYDAIAKVAVGDWTVLIEGETGTGKELVARAIHSASPRADAPFVAVNCGGMPESLLASMLFGHRRGAFTGAYADQQGVFEAAAGGTILLDEIGDIPPRMQVLLLRVLQEREIVRVGDSRPRAVDARILAATHRDLAAEAAAGQFREDLLYRVRVGRIRVPALRERLEDLPLLVSAFLAQERVSIGKPVTGMDASAMAALRTYPWPGNVRELKHTVEHAAIHVTDSVVRLKDLPEEVRAEALPAVPSAPSPQPDERERIRTALASVGGNRTKAARELGISRATLYRRLQQLGLDGS